MTDPTPEIKICFHKLSCAYVMGKDYGNWDADQFIQSDVAANVVGPDLRELAGFKDSGMGTYTEYEPPNDGNELDERLSALWDEFWRGFYEVNGQIMQGMEVDI